MATLKNLSGGSHGVTNDETGVVIQSISQTFNNPISMLKGKGGNTTALALNVDPVHTIVAKAALNGTTGLAAGRSGTAASDVSFWTAALVFANVLQAYGFDTDDDFFPETVQDDEDNNSFRMLTITAKRFPGIAE